MNKTILIASILFFVGVIADKFNITSVSLSNSGCDSTLFPGGQVNVTWQTSNQTTASQASCYVSLRRFANTTAVVEDNGTGSQVPCNQGSLSINISTSPMTNASSWDRMKVIARVTQISPFFGHNDSCSFTIMDPIPEICPMYPCKVALIGTLVPVGILTIIGCCICHRCWWKPKRVNSKSNGEGLIEPNKFMTV
ncbi:hypothetical protein BGW37DRAFT_473560 [Umbelopsis sp. PMI_123]|nr:hypothetical protein BGW37DRAFT_473560 [Umbelopsis sp. PMI_123]